MTTKTFVENGLAKAQKAAFQWVAANKGRVQNVKERPPVESRQPTGRFQKKADGKVMSVSITIEYEELSGP